VFGCKGVRRQGLARNGLEAEHERQDGETPERGAYEVAETKVNQVMSLAKAHGHPLQCVMERE